MTEPEPPEDEPFTAEEEAIIRTALSILPHLGSEATASYLDRVSHHEGNEHEA